jgi:hypothetical protein
MVDLLFDKIKLAPIRDEIVTYNGKEYRVSEIVDCDSIAEGEAAPAVKHAKLSSQLKALGFGSNDNKDNVALIVPLSKVRRDRQMITKNALRKFLKEVASRNSYLAGPWAVKVFASFPTFT